MILWSACLDYISVVASVYWICSQAESGLFERTIWLERRLVEVEEPSACPIQIENVIPSEIAKHAIVEILKVSDVSFEESVYIIVFEVYRLYSGI